MYLLLLYLVFYCIFGQCSRQKTSLHYLSMFDSIHLMKPEYLFRKTDENCLLNTSGMYFFFMLEFSQHSSITENVTVMTFGQDVKVIQYYSCDHAEVTKCVGNIPNEC